MSDVRVQDEQGTTHVFPDGSTPEQISQAMGLNPQSAKSQPAAVAAPPEQTMGQKVLSGAKDVLAGAGEGLMHTGMALSPLIHKIPGIGEMLAPEQGIMRGNEIARPKNMAQKIGFGGEQAAEFLLPTGVEEKGGMLAADLLPKLGKMAAPLGRIAGGALETGVKNKIQGGDFGTGAIMGGATGAVGEGMRAVAPKVAESALGITQRMRGRGRTIGDAVLGEIDGVRPATIAAESGKKIGGLTKEMEGAVHQATVQGVTGSTQPALDILKDAVDKTPRNARELIDKIKSLRDVLSLTPGQSGTSHTPDELLEIKRGIDKTIQTWGPEWQKMGDVQRVKTQLYGAIDSELDRLVSGNAEVNQRISSLIPAKQQAKKLESAASLPQKVAHRMAAHTGALMGSAMGGRLGYEEGGVPGAIAGGAAGLVLPELLSSPSAQMWAARRMASKVPVAAGRGIASRLMKRDDQ